ncbi:hypothetical protein [Burkholderia stagnalis]|uniref:hypothetical protein n=1 Tax=Burkholderia stagnalis TaxID=1503054 RepID=UPI0012D88191|nr:hypothetical protein [Burkholderia stagnalis]
MSRNVGRNIGAIAADAVASTLGNMVVDRIQGASIAKTSAPGSTDLLTQQAIAAVNGQVLPAAIGGGGSGFMPLDTSYNGNAGLFGVAGGAMTTLDAVTSAASVDALAASRVPYSGAAVLCGPVSMGLGDPTSLSGARPFYVEFDEPFLGAQVAGPGAGETTLAAIARGVRGGYAGLIDPNPKAAYAGKLLNDASQSFEQFGRQLIGAQSADEARANWAVGNYGMAAVKEVQAFAEAGLTVMGGSGALRQVFTRTVESGYGLAADTAAQTGGAGSTRFLRTEGLGPHSTMADLRATGALPGDQGGILSDRTVRFGDVYELAILGGRRVEFSLVTERIDGSVVKKLYSGDAWTSPVPRDARLIGHVPPNENAFQMWPSAQDMNMVNARYFRELSTNSGVAPMPTRIFGGRKYR